MLRGMVVIFTAAFSVAFLKRKLYKYHWFSIVVITTGLFLVGTSVFLDAGLTATPT